MKRMSVILPLAARAAAMMPASVTQPVPVEAAIAVVNTHIDRQNLVSNVDRPATVCKTTLPA
jgi:hypothetical protein